MAAGAISERQVLFLERGHPGIVPCSPDASSAYTLANLEGAYWYFGQYGRDGFLLSLTPRGFYSEGISEGVYNISSDYSLIIQNVTDSDEGVYFYRIEPLMGRIYEGSVDVAVKGRYK